MREIIKKEGDYKSWVYQAKNGTRYNCVIKRNKALGSLCGYVEIDKDNKLHGTPYLDLNFEVHGGITYGDTTGDCSIFGFDCAHFGDMTFFKGSIGDHVGIYRDMDYVTKECEKLAEQFSEWSISADRNKKIDSLV
jgi:acetyltransferase-like isoleucine patch superfamily enzyme